jgi:uncharacterized membrane protein
MEQLKSSKELKATARERLLGNYSVLILAYAIMQGIFLIALNLVKVQSGSSSLLYWAVYLLLSILSAVFLVGQYWLYRKVLRNNKPSINDMWNGFRHHPDKAIGIQLTIFVMSFLCAIPFFIVLAIYSFVSTPFLYPFIAITFIFFMLATIYISLTFSQALYLLIDYPSESLTELLKHSARMMRGHKFRLFYLNVSFIGIMLLTLLTFGIGMLWTFPYMTCTRTLFYEELYALDPI